MFQILPDMTSIVSKWQSLSKKENTGSEDKTTKNEGSAKQADNKSELSGNNIYIITITFINISQKK